MTPHHHTDLSWLRIVRGRSVGDWFGCGFVMVVVLLLGTLGWYWYAEACSIARLNALGAICLQRPVLWPDLPSGAPGMPPLVVLQTCEIAWQPRPQTIEQPDWSLFRHLPHLESLTWESSPLTPRDLQAIPHLSHLRRLQLRSVPIPDGMLSRLATLPCLVELRLHDCRWSPGQLEDLGSSRVLEVLQLDFSPVAAAELPSLACIPTLKHLSLTGSGLSDSDSQVLLGLRPDLELSDD